MTLQSVLGWASWIFGCISHGLMNCFGKLDPLMGIITNCFNALLGIWSKISVPYILIFIAFMTLVGLYIYARGMWKWFMVLFLILVALQTPFSYPESFALVTFPFAFMAVAGFAYYYLDVTLEHDVRKALAAAGVGTFLGMAGLAWLGLSAYHELTGSAWTPVGGLSLVDASHQHASPTPTPPTVWLQYLVPPIPAAHPVHCPDLSEICPSTSFLMESRRSLRVYDAALFKGGNRLRDYKLPYWEEIDEFLSEEHHEIRRGQAKLRRLLKLHTIAELDYIEVIEDALRRFALQAWAQPLPLDLVLARLGKAPANGSRILCDMAAEVLKTHVNFTTKADLRGFENIYGDLELRVNATRNKMGDRWFGDVNMWECLVNLRRLSCYPYHLITNPDGKRAAFKLSRHQTWSWMMARKQLAGSIIYIQAVEHAQREIEAFRDNVCEIAELEDEKRANGEQYEAITEWHIHGQAASSWRGEIAVKNLGRVIKAPDSKYCDIWEFEKV